MKKIHKKVLIVIGLKIVEMLAAAACIASAGSILCGIGWLIRMSGRTDLLVTIFIYVVLAFAGSIGLYLIGTMIKEWFKWNWDKAERIITRNER